jgi:nicotinamide-nucleotide amidase
VAERAPTLGALVKAARALGRATVERGWHMASAESCTGGMFGHVVTEVPRASDHYLGGIVSYSNAVKEEVLGVPGDLIERVGAVSAEVAEAMTAGVLARFPGAELAVAITGIAGPDGGSEEKPVGLTYVAAALRSGPAVVERHLWTHDRSGNKAASTLAALDLAARVVRG